LITRQDHIPAVAADFKLSRGPWSFYRSIEVCFERRWYNARDRAGSWPLSNIALANALKLRGYDFHFRFGTSLRAIAQGALGLRESLAWLWRDYDRGKTGQTYEMEEAERVKPVFRVSITNRDAW